MKLLKTSEKGTRIKVVKTYLSELEQYIVFAYLFCMLGIFPLYYKEQYYGIGNAKFEFFWKISLGFIGVSLIFFVMKFVLEKILNNTFSNKSIRNSYKIEEHKKVS